MDYGLWWLVAMLQPNSIDEFSCVGYLVKEPVVATWDIRTESRFKMLGEDQLITNVVLGWTKGSAAIGYGG